MTQENLVGKTVLSCTLNIGVGIICIGILAGLIAVAPAIEDWRAQMWEQVSGIITNGGSSVLPAAYIQWMTFLLAAWSLCIALKLGKQNSLWGIPFGLLSLSSILLGLIPSYYAMMSVCGEWTRDFISIQPFAIRTAVGLATILPAIGPVLFIVCLLANLCGDDPVPNNQTAD
ncbi:MAG: hypothetical protein ACNJA3_28015 (plasmid) [Pseudomonas rhizophila]|uniref:hypothetical protein n=1 Tax=Pseudomonas rhizophila TaxID=2045200 RepID=UPI003F6D3206